LPRARGGRGTVQRKRRSSSPLDLRLRLLPMEEDMVWCLGRVGSRPNACSDALEQGRSRTKQITPARSSAILGSCGLHTGATAVEYVQPRGFPITWAVSYCAPCTRLHLQHFCGIWKQSQRAQARGVCSMHSCRWIRRCDGAAESSTTEAIASAQAVCSAATCFRAVLRRLYTMTMRGCRGAVLWGVY
jgi:hypothetical protein